MLPHADLKPLWKKVVWIWVFRDFKDSKEERDAARTMDRFGLSVYPVLLMINPADNTVIEEIGRTKKAILDAADRAAKQVPKPDPSWAGLAKQLKTGEQKTLEKIAAGRDKGEFYLEARDLLEGENPKYAAKDLEDPDFDRRAIALDWYNEKYEGPFEKKTLALLKDRDGAVRVRAVRYVAKAKPDLIVKSAGELLADPVDAIKWQILTLLGKNGDADTVTDLICDAWKKLDSGKLMSHNDNVFRLNMARVLKEKGTAEAAEILRKQATDKNPNNGATRFAVEALGEIGKRHGMKHVAAILLDAFPLVNENPRAIRLAEVVNTALGGRVPMPKSWTAESRNTLIQTWKEILGR